MTITINIDDAKLPAIRAYIKQEQDGPGKRFIGATLDAVFQKIANDMVEQGMMLLDKEDQGGLVAKFLAAPPAVKLQIRQLLQ